VLKHRPHRQGERCHTGHPREGATKQIEKPQLFKIANYPNPFYESLIIEYALPCDGYLAINIFNIKGELIRVLGQEKQIKGSHSIL
jgi:hypothetical protein